MLRVLIPVGIVGLGLMIYSLVESLQTPRHRVRVLPKAAWIAVIILVPIIGAGLWLAFGRVKPPKNNGGTPGRKIPQAPDDDPEFLRQVEIQRRQKRRAEEARLKAISDRKEAEEKLRNTSHPAQPESTTDADAAGATPPADQGSEAKNSESEESDSGKSEDGEEKGR